MRRQSKSNELTELLKYQITSGKLKAGDQLEAIVKLAKRHNTTIVTVSKAQKILEQLGYVECIPNKGIFVKEKKSCCLAIVLDDCFFNESPSFAFLPILVKEIDRKCHELNWTYELFFNVKDRRSAGNFLLKLSQNSFDAVLIGSLWLAQNSSILFNTQRVLPVGIYNYKELELSLFFNPYQMIYNAVMELDRLGCQQIVLIDSNKDMSWSKTPGSSVSGYHDALKSTGRMRSSNCYLKVPLSQQGGHDAFGQILLNGKIIPPLGIVSTDSLITMGLIQAVLSMGFRIPDDIIIATHANQGCGASQFPIPVIKYEYPVRKHIERVFEYLKCKSLVQKS